MVSPSKAVQHCIISSCYYQVYIPYISYSEAPSCTENAVRFLVNRIQICNHKNKWGYVCGDTDWMRSKNSAGVACREVGFRPEGEVMYFQDLALLI